MTEPTDDEILEAVKHLGAAMLSPVEVARAVLAKWGTPAPSGDAALPAIKGASITGGYVVVTPAGRADNKAATLRDAILRTFPVNAAYTPSPDAARKEGNKP